MAQSVQAQTWTPWFDNNDPIGGYGEVEPYPVDPLTVCNGTVATGVECREQNTSLPLSASQEDIMCDARKGLRCIDQFQADGTCEDYKIRFLCDDIIPSCSDITSFEIEEVFAPCGGPIHSVGKYIAFVTPSNLVLDYQWEIFPAPYGTVSPDNLALTNVSLNVNGLFTLKLTTQCLDVNSNIVDYTIQQNFTSSCGHTGKLKNSSSSKN